MADLYKEIPVFENNRFMLRAVAEQDSADLREVYGDKNALPFFNSDNCDGDNFYYATEERMREAIRFWQSAYENQWFVRWAVVDKLSDKVVGTIELCHRISEDAFHDAGILRIDVRNDYEQSALLFQIGSLIVFPAFELLKCRMMITKAPIYAVERIKAMQDLGFLQSKDFLIGKDGYAYNGYWTIGRE